MSTRNEAVLAALNNLAQTRNEIAENTGLEVAAVSQELSILRGKGLAERTAEGWTATGAAPGVRTHVAMPAEAPPPARRRKNGAKGKGVWPPPPRKAEARIPYARFGEYVVLSISSLTAITVQQLHELIEELR